MSAGTPVTEAKVVPANTVYTATVEVSGGRGGSARSLTGSLRVDLTRPAQRGPDAPGTDPEELFAAGYAACFHSALRVVARQAKADVSGSVVEAEVGIGPNGSGGYGLAVTLVVDLPAVERAAAE